MIPSSQNSAPSGVMTRQVAPSYGFLGSQITRHLAAVPTLRTAPGLPGLQGNPEHLPGLWCSPTGHPHGLRAVQLDRAFRQLRGTGSAFWAILVSWIPPDMTCRLDNAEAGGSGWSSDSTVRLTRNQGCFFEQDADLTLMHWKVDIRELQTGNRRYAFASDPSWVNPGFEPKPINRGTLGVWSLTISLLFKYCSTTSHTGSPADCALPTPHRATL